MAWASEFQGLGPWERTLRERSPSEGMPDAEAEAAAEGPFLETVKETFPAAEGTWASLQ